MPFDEDVADGVLRFNNYYESSVGLLHVAKTCMWCLRRHLYDLENLPSSARQGSLLGQKRDPRRAKCEAQG